MNNQEFQTNKQKSQNSDINKANAELPNSENVTLKKNQSAKFRTFIENQSSKPKYTRYFWEKANERPKKDVNTPNIDRYYDRLKATRQKPQHQFKVFELQSNQIPTKLYSAQMKCSMKSPPKKMINIFNESDCYDCKQPRLINHLPESFAAESFKNYLEKNHERVPDILDQPFSRKATNTIAPTTQYEPDFVDPYLENFDFDNLNS